MAGFVGFYGRLDGGDGFTMRPRPVPVTVPYGGGLAIPAFTVSDKYVCEGKYTTKLYAGPFSQFLLQWAAQQVNTGGFVGPAGASTGWATTEIAGNMAIGVDLPRDPAQYRRVQDAGVSRLQGQVVVPGHLAGFADRHPVTRPYRIGGAGQPVRQLDRSDAHGGGHRSDLHRGPAGTGSTFAYPATNNLPTSPYLFINASNTGGSGSAGFLEIGSGALTARTTFQSVKLSCTNKLMTRFWANRFVAMSLFCGRDLTLAASNFYSNSPDDRTAYEGLTGQSISFSLSNGTHSASFVMNTSNIITSLEDSLPLEDIYTQVLTATSQWDPSVAGTDPALANDFTMSFT